MNVIFERINTGKCSPEFLQQSSLFIYLRNLRFVIHFLNEMKMRRASGAHLHSLLPHLHITEEKKRGISKTVFFLDRNSFLFFSMLVTKMESLK